MVLIQYGKYTFKNIGRFKNISFIWLSLADILKYQLHHSVFSNISITIYKLFTKLKSEKLFIEIDKHSKVVIEGLIMSQILIASLWLMIF